MLPRKNIFKQLYYQNIDNLKSLNDVQYVKLIHKNCPQNFNFCWGINNIHFNIVITRSVILNNKLYLLLDNDESFKISYIIVINLDIFPSTDSISFINLDPQKKLSIYGFSDIIRDTKFKLIQMEPEPEPESELEPETEPEPEVEPEPEYLEPINNQIAEPEFEFEPLEPENEPEPLEMELLNFEPEPEYPNVKLLVPTKINNLSEVSYKSITYNPIINFQEKYYDNLINKSYNVDIKNWIDGYLLVKQSSLQLKTINTDQIQKFNVGDSVILKKDNLIENAKIINIEIIANINQNIIHLSNLNNDFTNGKVFLDNTLEITNSVNTITTIDSINTNRWTGIIGNVGDDCFLKIELTNYKNTNSTILESNNLSGEPEPEPEPLSTIRIEAGFKFYGKIYNDIFIGTNGYITFVNGDTNSIGTLENHLLMPRLSFLFTDLNLAINTISTNKISNIEYGYIDDTSNNGNIIYKNSIFCINFNNVCDGENFIKDNTVQLLIYLENSDYKNRGKIIVNYQNIGSNNGIIGLSNGLLPATFSYNDIIENQIM